MNSVHSHLGNLVIFVPLFFFISGTVDLRGRGRPLLPGGVGMPGARPAGLVQERDAGELQQPGLCG